MARFGGFKRTESLPALSFPTERRRREGRWLKPDVIPAKRRARARASRDLRRKRRGGSWNSRLTRSSGMTECGNAMQPSWLRHRLGIIWREHADKGNRAGGKMRGIFRLTVLVGAGAAMLGIAAPHHAFAAASRAAQPNSTASDQFADAFFAIASHGDLLDIPFIEQTLQTQFQSRLAIEGGGIPNPKRTIYETGADSDFS